MPKYNTGILGYHYGLRYKRENLSKLDISRERVCGKNRCQKCISRKHIHILQMGHTIKDKSKLEDHKLVINGVCYGVRDLTWLPAEQVPYKAVQHENQDNIIFHGELSPHSNFHNSPFVIDNQQFPSSEHWIQYRKALLFGDSFTANQILYSSTPQEAKCLSKQIKEVDQDQW